MTALLAGSIAVPTALSASTAQAAEACRSGIPTYVHDVSSESDGVLRKYLDWDPLTGNATGALLDTGETAPLERYSEFFTGGHGIIYVKTPEGALKTYKDNSATGGSMLTPVRNYGGNWNVYERMWSTGDNRIFALHQDGALEVYSVANPSSGSGAITKIRTVPSTDPAVVAIAQATDVWSAGPVVYTLKRGVPGKHGEVKAWRYSDGVWGLPFPNGSTTVITGISNETRGWSPGPGTIYTVGDSPDYTGIAWSYTGTAPMDVANPDVGAGIYGDVHADIASCLASPSPDVKPSFGPVPPETETPPQAVIDWLPDPAPQDPTQFSGKFVLGDGRPAAGLPVRVEAVDVTSDSTDEVQLVTLGTTVTAPDGTWTVPLPTALPESVKRAAANNGGIINAMASVNGETSSGHMMRGTHMMTAAPATAPATARALVAAAAEDDSEPSKMRPIIDDLRKEQAQPTVAQTNLSWASRDEQVSVDTLGDRPLPEYQSDTVREFQGDPYVVDGVDTKSLVVRPMDGGCDKTSEKVIDKQIKYTTVAEGHAYWDAKTTVDYDSKLSSSVEVAVKTGTRWTIEGSVTLGSAMSVTTGYANKGPFFAKQWRVPIEYKKIREKWTCNYGRDTFYRYKIMGSKYKVPSGGAVGKYGKDVSNRDGSVNYGNSPKKHRAWVPQGAHFQISKNRSIKWSGAVSAYGIKLGGSTQYDRDHRQRITAGNKKARHDIWGKNDKVDGKPGVFYSY
ncbi:hypothetical protein C1I97_04575 [Streptomyces sp. NTH33]|uniref:hypothetical protein n=1 Tax=Streptomyces sp. NTH33 TaxID=1735453 RepID=UPI000DA996D2|nr:hypothetical protein [Streptomyces sp. NTH33]PZH17864.1 hypothetical protein C1I97_04575 [Streptomyces sp. NTH33]